MYNYLRDNYCLDAVRSGYISVAHDTAQNRAVFYNKQGGVGRSLNGATPKWYKYKGSHSSPLLVGKGKTLVIVEDIASACSVSRNPRYTGCALLGTNFLDSYIPYMDEYDKLVIALDPDARRHAFNIKHLLTLVHNDVTIWFITDDLKYMDCTEYEHDTRPDKIIPTA